MRDANVRKHTVAFRGKLQKNDSDRPDIRGVCLSFPFQYGFEWDKSFSPNFIAADNLQTIVNSLIVFEIFF